MFRHTLLIYPALLLALATGCAGRRSGPEVAPSNAASRDGLASRISDDRRSMFCPTCGPSLVFPHTAPVVARAEARTTTSAFARPTTSAAGSESVSRVSAKEAVMEANTSPYAPMRTNSYTQITCFHDDTDDYPPAPHEKKKKKK